MDIARYCRQIGTMTRNKVLVLFLGMLPICSSSQLVSERRAVGEVCGQQGNAKPNCSAVQLSDSAAAMHVLGQLGEAENLASQALRALSSEPAESSARAIPLYILASIQLERGLTGRARETYGEMQRIRGATPSERALICGTGAALSQIAGRWEEAEAEYKEAAANFENAGREHGAESAGVLAQLATLYINERRHARALAVVDQAFKSLDSATDAVPLDRIKLLTLRGVILGQLHRWRDAETDFAQAVALTHSQQEVDALSFKKLAENYAAVLRKVHRNREAKVVSSWAAALRSGQPVSGQVIDITELMQPLNGKAGDK